MPISLELIQQKLNCRISTLDSGFDRHVVKRSHTRRLDRFALQEGYVSALWQAWCAFCRELLICSAQGATTARGAVIASPYTVHSEMEIAFIARQLANGNVVRTIRPLLGSHQEHTWGDLGKLNSVVSGLGCGNAPQVLTALSACLRIEDLQLCRNASAHIGKSTIQEIKKARVRYLDTRMQHPSDMMYWVDPGSSHFLWKSWIEEIELSSQLAVQ
ncbi:hypothetical protein T8A63_12815 [Sulfitobacter sp. OXR-159]|uniref:hypothetical protein n=1 Tax=Sulfitobacter sp. OXR-159 TaxID=3100174 RepID=UPI002AC8E9AB|nr:hypothetical protein [Sulfitobacter sp. OXR-159]WPZ28510.1 hypothetical protein T8A63_12815 [Sulfitobacter sp. OXR-159]